MEKYYQDETFTQKAQITDASDNNVDPTTIIITIEAPDGTNKIEEASMNYVSVGIYRYDYLIPADAEEGGWKTEVKATKDTVAVEQDEFAVIRRL